MNTKPNVLFGGECIEFLLELDKTPMLPNVFGQNALFDTRKSYGQSKEAGHCVNKPPNSIHCWHGLLYGLIEAKLLSFRKFLAHNEERQLRLLSN